MRDDRPSYADLGKGFAALALAVAERDKGVETIRSLAGQLLTSIDPGSLITLPTAVYSVAHMRGGAGDTPLLCRTEGRRTSIVTHVSSLRLSEGEGLYRLVAARSARPMTVPFASSAEMVAAAQELVDLFTTAEVDLPAKVPTPPRERVRPSRPNTLTCTTTVGNLAKAVFGEQGAAAATEAFARDLTLLADPEVAVIVDESRTYTPGTLVDQPNVRVIVVEAGGTTTIVTPLPPETRSPRLTVRFRDSPPAQATVGSAQAIKQLAWDGAVLTAEYRAVALSQLTTLREVAALCAQIVAGRGRDVQ